MTLNIQQVISAQTGDLRAFDKIVRRFQDMAFATAYARLGDSHLAEDAAQDAFIEAFKGLKHLQAPEAFPSWFRRIVTRRCNRIIRDNRAVLVPLDHAAAMPSEDVDPVVAAERGDRRRCVASLIQALPEHERATVVLFYLQQYDLAEIAEFLAIKQTTVKQRLFSARKRLKTGMETMLHEEFAESRPSKDDLFADSVQLIAACDAGDLAAVRALLDRSPDLIQQKQFWKGSHRPPLHAAATNGHADIVELLLDRGMDVMFRDEGDNATALHFASECGRLDVVRVLIDRGADVNATDDLHERGPLGWATVFANVQRDVAELLISRGAELDIFSAVALGDEAAVRRIVAENPAAIKARMSEFDDRRSPVLFARSKKNSAMVKLLTELGDQQPAANETSSDDRDQTARALIEADDVDALSSMVSADPELLNRLNADHMPALVRAAFNGSPRVAAFLVESGVDIEQRDGQHKNTGLGWAAYSGKYDVVALLVDRGANLSHRDIYENSPLGWAIRGRDGTSQKWGAPSDRSLFLPIIDLLRQRSAPE